MKTRILIADDHAIFREGLRALLHKDPDLEVVGDASNGIEAIEQAASLEPDCVVMDIRMPKVSGIDAAREILQKKQEIKVLALTTYADKHYLEAAFRVGCSAYLLKDSAFDELYQAIGTVLSGESYISPRLSEVMISNFTQKQSTQKSPSLDVLTEREVDVLKAIAHGHSNKEIARDLFLSVRTVEAHRASLMEKLEMRSVADLTKFALREKLVAE